jgi:3,4-dihydroxy 2-butanone 4-phosphate synthase / GTP cyclohydrolase II
VKLADWLTREGVTRLAFAGRLGVSDTTIYRLASGRQRPSFELAVRIERETAGAVQASDLLETVEVAAVG